mmetsp:Transcript_14022/g.38752  ORF Transcript_14022/g.38752 Transcript_14022/m.38752 type:complete len:261 (+) Transcript_14022:91-873(+)
MAQGNCGCCCKNSCPTTGFAICAVIASAIFAFFCKSVKIEAISVEGADFLLGNNDLRFGPWTQLRTKVIDVGPGLTIQTQDSCVEWDNNPDIDSKWTAVRAFTIITVVLGALLTLIVSMADCIRPSHIAPLWRPISGCFLIVLPLFQGLTFLLFRSDACDANAVTRNLEREHGSDEWAPRLYEEECSWDTGSSANVISVVLWFATGVAMFVTGPPAAPERAPPETQEVTYQKTQDGGVVEEVKVVQGTAVEQPVEKVEEA